MAMKINIFITEIYTGQEQKKSNSMSCNNIFY